MKRWLIINILVFFGVNGLWASEFQSNVHQPEVARPESPSGGSTTERGIVSPDMAKIPAINSKNIQINYSLDPKTAQNVERVEIWYSRGHKGPWQLFGYDRDRRSPAWFIAPSEGLFNILVVAVDKQGRYSCDIIVDENNPHLITVAQDVEPHQSFFVDYTPPQLFLGVPEKYQDEHNKVVPGRYVLSWTGFDTYLSYEPLSLFWSSVPQGVSPGSHKDWQSMGPRQLSAGKFHWDMPHNAVGPITIKAVLTDLGGNKDIKYVTMGQDGEFLGHYSEELGKRSSVVGTVTHTELDKAKLQEKAIEFYSRAVFYYHRNDWNSAYHNCQKALEFLPDYNEARLLMGQTLLELNEPGQANDYFMAVLKAEPDNDLAMLGHIQCLNAQGYIDEAEELLDQRNRRWRLRSLGSEPRSIADESGIVQE